MGLSKQQIKDHIANVRKKLQSETEQAQHGFEFAKLCFRVEEYEDAIGYLEKYLVVNSRDYRAQKWMGRLCEAVGDRVKAVLYYEKSLELHPDQRNIVFKVADLYLGIDNPPKEALQKCLSAVERINISHPLTFALYEKLQQREGKQAENVAVDKLLTQQLRSRFPDPNVCIQLVKKYIKSDKMKQSFDCCQIIDLKKIFEDSLAWQQVSLLAAELHFQELCKMNNVDSNLVLDCCVAIMRRCSCIFRLSLGCGIAWNSGRELELSSRILKFDRVLKKSCSLLDSISSSSKAISLLILKELRGQLFLMCAQYLYVKSTDKKTVAIKALADLCLLVSLNTTPPDVESYGPLTLTAKLKVEEWRSIACERYTTVGWQLLSRVAQCGRTYLEDLTTRIKDEDKLILIKELFGHQQQVSLGKENIVYDAKQSAIASDDSILKVSANLPAVNDLVIFDEYCVTACKFNLHKLLLRCVNYEALNKVAPVSKWLKKMFPDLMWSTTDLSVSTTGSLCRLDLEAFLVVKYEDLKEKILGKDKEWTAAAEKSFICWKPLQRGGGDLWKAVLQYLQAESSVLEVVSQKKDLQKFLHSVRGHSTTMDQLIILARHFKRQAEAVDAQKGDGLYNYRSIVKTLLQWTSHYWTIVIERMNRSTSVGAKRSLFSVALPTTKGYDGILDEAQFTLGKAALYNNDPSVALQHFSKVNTPQAAWNQAQIYMLMADQDGADPHKSMLYIRKAQTLTQVSSQSDYTELQEKLQAREDEIKQMLKRLSFDSHVESEDPISSIPQLQSTPANPPRVAGKDQLEQDGSFDKSLQDTLKEKDQQICDMMQQLQLLQEEVKGLRLKTSYSEGSRGNSLFLSKDGSEVEGDDDPDEGTSSSLKEDEEEADVDTPTLSCVFSSARMPDAQLGRNTASVEVPKIIFAPQSVPPLLASQSLFVNPAAFSATSAAQESLPASSQSVNPSTFSSVGRFSFSSQPAASMFSFGQPEVAAKESSAPPSLLQSQSVKASPLFPAGIPSFSAASVSKAEVPKLNTKPEFPPPPPQAQTVSPGLFSFSNQSAKNLFSFKPEVSKEITVPGSLPPPSLSQSVQPSTIFSGMLSFSTASSGEKSVSETLPPPSLSLSQSVKPGLFSHPLSSVGTFSFSTDKPELPKEKTGQETLSQPPLLPSMQPNTSSERLSFTTASMSETQKIPGFMPLPSSLFSSLQPRTVSSGMLSFSTASSGQSEAPNIFGSMPPPPIFSSLQPNTGVLSLPTAGSSGKSESPKLPGSMPLPPLFNSVQPSTISSGMFTSIAASSSMSQEKSEPESLPLPPVSLSQLAKPGPFALGMLSASVDEPKHDLAGQESQPPLSQSGTSARASLSTASSEVSNEVSVPESLPPPLVSQSVQPSAFSSAGMLSFSDLMSKSSSNTTGFGKASGLEFQGTGNQLFTSKQDAEVEGSDNPEEEADVDFKPIVTLPDTYDQKSWDDNADTLFAHRCKLFRYDAGSKQWKERGVGDMKIMKHKTSGKVRLIMRRDQILKICCNHYISKEMKLVPGNSEKSWIWFTHSDYSDETPKEEKLAVRFKHVETASEFRRVFDECVCEAQQAQAVTDVEREDKPLPSRSAVDNWECEGCYTFNNSDINTCVACKAPKPDYSGEAPTELRQVDEECVSDDQQAQAVTDVEREDKPLPSRSAVDNWECEGCYTFNNSDINTCVACKAPKPDYSGEAPTELRQVDEECVSEDQEDADSSAIETIEESHVVEVSDTAETSEPVNIPLQFPLASSLDGDHSLQLPINRDQHSPVSSLQLPLVKEAGIELVPSLPLEGTSPSDNEDVLTSEDVSDSADASDGESVIFLYEELPSSELITKAEKFMLPPSFYLCENKSPCPGCRGCEETDNSDGKKDVVDMSNTNSAPQSSSPPPPSQSQPLKTSDLESQSAAGSVVSEVPKEKSESLPPPLSVSQTVQSSAFSSAGMVSFSDLLSSNTTGFGKAKGFTFQGAGSQLFASKQDAEVEGSDNPEEEADVDFKPIVTLPDTYDQKSWDDNADTLFAHRCKLFRYDAGSKQWKERGVGDMKIMKHRTSGKVRLIMRRDQILKICCNHYISKEMKLVPGNSEKSWIWFTHSDYSDETPKEEKLAMRFKHVETASEFRRVFDECVCEAQQAQAVTDVEREDKPLPSRSAVDNWECEGCYTFNNSDINTCVACKAPKPDYSGEAPTELRQVDEECVSEDQGDADSSAIETIEESHVVEVSDAAETSEPVNIPLQFPLASSLDGDHSLQLPINRDQHSPVSSLQLTLVKEAGIELVSSLPLEGTSPSDNEDVLTSEDVSDSADASDGESVIFLYEELPSSELIAKAEKFMLPPSFYLCENKSPCPGCRGCEETDNSDGKKDVVDMSNTNSAPQSSSPPPPSQSQSLKTSDLESQSAAGSVVSEVPKEKSESLPTPLSVSQTVQASAFSSAGMVSFSDLLSSNTTGFGKAKGFTFQGAGSQLFASKQDAEVEGSDNPEEEADVDFKPIVTLPDTYDQKSWDDNADTLFAHRCKLFRYDAGSKQWKERGVGDMKIMKHRTSGKVRLIMRRDQILKICCNHYISKEMKLVPGNSEKSWIWFTHSDYSDETPKEEKLAVRFKHVETASEFRRVFDECVCEAQQAQAVTDVEREDKPLPSRSAVDNWECEGCYTFNNSDINTCVACKAPKPDCSGEAPTELRQVDEECVSEDQEAQALTDVEREDKPLL